MNRKDEELVLNGEKFQLCGDVFGIYIVIDKVTGKIFTCRSMKLIAKLIGITYWTISSRDWDFKPEQTFNQFTVKRSVLLQNSNVKFSVNG